MRLHGFLLLGSSSGERRHRFFVIIRHSRNETFHEKATEFYDVIAIFVFAEGCQCIGSASRVAFSERARKPGIGDVLNIIRIGRTNFIN